MIAPTSRQEHSCRAGGGGRDAKAGKMGGETKFPCCAFARIPLYCKLLTEQISLVFLRRRHLSRLGVSTASLAGRHQGAPALHHNTHRLTTLQRRSGSAENRALRIFFVISYGSREVANMLMLLTARAALRRS